MCRQLVVNIMTHEMNRRTNAIRQMPGQFVIGAVHAAPGSKVATHQHVAAHLCPWASPRAAPANAPARNQYCNPTCVVNGVKPKIRPSVPTLMAKTMAAQERRLEPCQRARRYSYTVVEISAKQYKAISIN